MNACRNVVSIPRVRKGSIPKILPAIVSLSAFGIGIVPFQSTEMSITHLSVLGLFLSALPVFRATGLEDLARSVIQLTEDVGAFDEIGTNRLQIYWRIPNTDRFIPKPNPIGGTGLLVGSRKGKPFIVTAKHVAAQITKNGIIYLGQSNETAKIGFGNFVGPQNWIHHPAADISIHPVNPHASQTNSLQLWVIPFHWFTNASAPARDIDLAVLGFPFGLGREGMFSPISRQSKAASGILRGCPLLSATGSVN